MTYRTYIRNRWQQVSDKTVTEDPEIALAAFTKLVNRTDLDGAELLIVLNRDGKSIAHHHCDGTQPASWWRGRLHEVPL